MVTTLISKALSEVRPTLRTNGMGISNTHRRISLSFFPIDKKNPLVRKYRKRKNVGGDQRSYQSLGEDFGSGVRDAEFSINRSADEDDYLNDSTDGGELSRTVSLPSRVSETPDVSQLDNDWILQEHERRYSSLYNSDPEEQEESEVTDRYPTRELDYDEFMYRLHVQKRMYENERANFKMKPTRRPSFVSFSSGGTVPMIYQEYDEGRPIAQTFANVTFESESKIIASYSFPLIFTFLLEQMFPMVCSLTVGHLGSNELAAVSLASMTSNITLAIFEGIATSLDTLCPQAYGSGKFYSVGIHLQRCIVFSLAVFIPFAIFWYYSEPVLSLVVPEKELVKLTSKFLRVLILGAPPYIFFENLKRFLQAQGIFDAGIYVLTICAPLNILFSYNLVWNRYFGVGFIGAAIAVVINFWMMFLLLLLYTLHIQGKKCWGGFTNKAFTHWGDLTHLAISGIIMLEAEELSYELLTLFSAYFGTKYLAAQSAVSTTAALLYMVPFAIGISASTRIANFIGAKRPDLANIASRVGLSFSLVAGLTNCCVLILSRRIIAKIFSRDEAVLKLIASLLPLVGIAQNFDSLNAVAGACLRGQGMQTLGSIVNIAIYYLIAIPMAIFLSYFLDWKLYGLWVGIGTGMLLIGLIESYYVLFPDWQGIMSYAEMLQETEDDEDSDTDSAYVDSDEEPDESSPLLS